MPMMPEITLIEMEDGSCKIKADMSKYNGGVKYLHVKESQWRMLQGMLKYYKGSLMQDCFHFLQPSEREFMLTGMTPIEQERFFNKAESFMGSSSVD